MVPKPAARTTRPTVDPLVSSSTRSTACGSARSHGHHHGLDPVRGLDSVRPPHRGSADRCATRTTLVPRAAILAGQLPPDPVAGAGHQGPRAVPVVHDRLAWSATGAGSTASTKNAPARQTAAAVEAPACRPDRNASLTFSHGAWATDAGDCAATANPGPDPRGRCPGRLGACAQDRAVGQPVDVQRREDAADHATPRVPPIWRVASLTANRRRPVRADHAHDRVGGRRRGQAKAAAPSSTICSATCRWDASTLTVADPGE